MKKKKIREFVVVFLPADLPGDAHDSGEKPLGPVR